MTSTQHNESLSRIASLRSRIAARLENERDPAKVAHGTAIDVGLYLLAALFTGARDAALRQERAERTKGTAAPGMTRQTDPASSADAARSVEPHVTDLQARILEILIARFRHSGDGATTGELERRAEFAELRPSTVRKRVTELHRLGLLERTKRKRRRMAVYLPTSLALRLYSPQTQGTLFA